jgi:catechol 2,3-dioxygenase-like lactoylglutathione lyase family enzyme
MTPLTSATPVTFILTRNRAEAEKWYESTLGLRRDVSDAFAAVFDLEGVPLRITEIPDFSPSPHPVLGWMVADIVSTVKELAAAGIKFTIYEGMGQDELGIWTAPDSGAKVAFFSDPDGNVLSLTQAG